MSPSQHRNPSTHQGDARPAPVASSAGAGLPAERLVEAAERLFSREGIRAVGVERLIAEARVARASLYQTYGSKDALIAAYLDRKDRSDRVAWQRRAVRAEGPKERILALFDLAIRSTPARGYRGCQYLNAVTEFPDPRHPASRAVRQHREWLCEMLTRELRAAGADDADACAELIQLLYDGALAGAKFSRSVAPIRLARDQARHLLDTRTGH